MLKQTEMGRVAFEVKKNFLQVRKLFEELILDVENLSKSNIYRDLELKENKNTQPDDKQQNPGRKLLNALSEAKRFAENIKSSTYSDDVAPEISQKIRQKQNK